MRYRNSVLVAVAILGLAVGAPAQAGVTSLTVKVDGLACPFCAYGVEKKLKKVEGVENLEIDIEKGKIALRVRPDARLTGASEGGKEASAGLADRVRKAVKEGGFTPREMRVDVEGTIAVRKDGWQLEVPETGETVPLRENGHLAGLKAEMGRRASITGTLEGEGARIVLVVGRVAAGAGTGGLEEHGLKISGMVCSGCADAIRTALEEVEGVLAAEVDVNANLAVVKVEPGKVNPERLLSAVNGMTMEGMPEGTFRAELIR